MADQRPKKHSTASREEAAPSAAEPETNPVDQAIEQSATLVQSEIEMAQLFLAHGKPEIARRRLEAVLSQYRHAHLTREALRILRAL